MCRKKLIRTIVTTTAVCLPALSTLAYGQEPARYDLRIERQSLSRALQEFARQSGVQIVFFSRLTDGYEAPSLNGKFTAAAALDALLDDSQLTFRELTPNTIEVRPRPVADDTATSASSPATQSLMRMAASGDDRSEVASGPMRLAQADRQGGSRSTGENDEPRRLEKDEPAASSSATTVAIPDVLVVGSRILNTDIRRTEDDAQPYMIFERVDLERSGARNVEDFLARRLTASTSSTTHAQNGDSALGNISSIDLRGLGQDETLILVDGRRIAGYSHESAPAQPDINGIPLAAIERIEVLPATASGIYGGGATGGVINIVLRRDYDGVDVKLTYGSSFDGGADRGQIDLSVGLPLEEGKTSILLAASYSDAGDLLVQDREFVRRGYDRFLANNPGVLLGSSPPLGATTNVSALSIGGIRPNLTLDNGTSLGAPITFVPAGYAGPASDNGAGLVANAGQYNLELADTANSGHRGLVYAPTIRSFSGTVRREFSSWLDAYVEFATSENEAEFPRGLSSTFALSGNNAGNPFQQAILVNTPFFGTDSIVESLLESDRAAAGVIIDLPAQWRAQADYTWNRTRYSFVQPSFLLDLTRVVADIGTGTLNIFRDTTSSDFASYTLGGIRSHVETTLDNPALRFSGPLPLSLPGGAPTLSLLLEYRKEAIGDQTAPVPTAPIPGVDILIPSRSQTVNSAYTELRLPIVAAGNAVPGIDLLELQLAGRWDDYETTGATNLVPRLDGVPVTPIVRETNSFDSVNPTFGVRYKPASDVMLRASYGTGFLPANMAQLVPATPTVTPPFILNLLGLTDPRRGGESLGASGQGVLARSGGNPDLDPEESESWSAGLVFTPRFAPGLRLSADWTRIEKTDNVGVLFLTQANLDLEQLVPGFVTRDTNPATFGSFGVGPIIELDQRLRNIARTEIEAYDFSADYTWASARLGEFRLLSAATHFVRNEAQAVPQAPLVDSAGTISGLQWRGNATLSWEYGNWSAAWTTRYFDSYRLFALGEENAAVVLSQGSLRVPHQTYHDLFASFRFGAQTGLLSGAEIQLGINNVFDTEPPVDLTQAGVFYSPLGDPRLANYYLSLRKSF